MNNELNKLSEMLIEQGIVTEAELNLVTQINGYSMETLNQILYARTGFKSFEQLED